MTAEVALADAIDGLLVAFRGAPELAGVQVVDGPPVEDVRGDVIGVALSIEDPAVDVAVSPAGLGRQDFESFVVTCLARSWHGDAAVAPRRQRSLALVAGARAALRADVTLGGAVTRARVVGVSYEAFRNAAGVVVSTPFRVAIDTFTR